MTPNEARQVLTSYGRQAQRTDALGRAARQDMREAYVTLARHYNGIAPRMRRRAVRAAYLEISANYRRAAARLEV